MAAERSQAGFSLLEVLVAFTILALGVGTIMALLGTDLRNGVAAADYSRALAWAEDKLTELELQPAGTLAPATEEGELENRFRWQTVVAPYTDAEPAGRAMLYTLQVRVAWEEGPRHRTVELETLRVGAQP